MTHHATLVRSALPLDYQLVAEMPVAYFSHDRIGVDEVKTLTSQAMLRPAEGSDQTFVVQTLFVTHEAQNALLKLLEEPPTGLRFVLVLPPAVRLLPTLLSRIGQVVTDVVETDDQAWQLFVAANHADRLAQIDSWQKTKEPTWLQAIVAGVHSLSYRDMPAAALPVVQMVGERLATRGASNKMLLEHLALALPLRK